MFEHTRQTGHEQVVFCRDRETGLQAIIAIHDTTLGPGLGGVRLRSYGSDDEALTDVLRLSEAMTWKASVAGLDLGGGKAVILGVPAPEMRASWFRALGRFVDGLGGRYIPTEDMGVFTRDIETLRETSRYGVGLDPERGGGGDPSPVTARGVFAGMRACLEAAGDGPELSGRKVVVQGAGKVGLALLELLVRAGAIVMVADVDEERVAAAVRLGATAVAAGQAHREECDIFAPCAAGAILDERTVPELRCRIVAGGANNQLAVDEDGDRLHSRGILYAPDFVINAGGLINVADELEPGGYDRNRALARAEGIGETCRRVFAEASAERLPPGRVALRLARRRVEKARRSAT